MTTPDFSEKSIEDKYQNRDTSSDLKIDDIEALKKKAAEQAAKIQEQKKQIAEKIQKLMSDTVKKATPFKKETVGKFKEQVVGMLVMPPKADKQLETKTGKLDENLDVLVILELRDIQELKKKLEKKQALEKKIKDIAKKKLKDHAVNVVLLEEIWDMCLKGKYDILNVLTMGQPLYDSGWVGALRMTELHKMRVLRKFEKYVVCYVLGGSMVRGEANEKSDVDTYIVIDDTDVTRMTSAELRQRLMGIIWGYAQEAAMAAGVKNVLNVQVYVLSDMWDSIKNAHPVIVTFLREGIPMYDRGMFAPWKQLLLKGKIKPTPEAITNYMKSGEQMVQKTEARLKEIAVEDFFWATCTPTQGALMLLGYPAPTPNHLASDMRKWLVKDKLIEDKYVKIWERVLKMRKDIEHGTVKKVSGKVVAELLEETKLYLKRIDKLFKEIEKTKIKEEIEDLYSKTVEDCLAAISMIGETATKKNAFNKFKEFLVDRQLASERYYNLIRKIEKVSQSRDTSRENIASLSFEQDKLSRDLFNIIQAEHGQKIEKFKISAQYKNGKKTAAVWLFTKDAYVILDIKDPETNILHYKISSNGAFTDEKSAKLAAIEKKLQTFAGTTTTMTKHTIESLKDILGDDVKLVIGA
jgi:predicted nucleotidyltransferase